MSIKQKHTPGPWWIDRADDVDLPNHVGISAEKHGLLAQVVWKMENVERSPHCEANAHLIIAAPDLLDALQSVIDFPADFFDRPDSEAVTITLTGWHLKKARSAITKATGEDK